jgi:hypothetical protein
LIELLGSAEPISKGLTRAQVEEFKKWLEEQLTNWNKTFELEKSAGEKEIAACCVHSILAFEAVKKKLASLESPPLKEESKPE